MSLFGSMRTGVSGMNAQANRLSTVADNIANVNTTGYKKASTSFSSMVLPSSSGNYNSGGVQTSVRRAISEQGGISYTTSETDLSISGAGFFIVQNASGVPVLTRDGSFQPDSSGNLVNSAGFTLMGYTYDSGAPAVVVNGFSGLVPVNLNNGALSVVPSTGGLFEVNLPAKASTVGTAVIELPSANPLNAVYNHKFTIASSDVVEDFYADVYFSKIDDNTWEVTAFGRHGATSPGSGPYDVSDPAPMATTTLTFDPATGAIVSGNPILTISSLDDPFDIDLSGMTQTTGSQTTTNVGVQSNLASDLPAIDIAGGDLPPSANSPASVFTGKQAWSGYSGLGTPIALDVYYTKTGADTWELTYFRSSDATAGGFPYSSGPLASETVSFDPATGSLVGPSSISVPVSGSDSVNIDLAGTTSLPSNDPAVANDSGGMSLSFNLSPAAAIAQPSMVGATPAQNLASSTYTNKTSLVAYDKLGNNVLLDIYYARGPDNSWEMTVFNHQDASASGFPYGVAGSAPLASLLLTFDDYGKLEDNPSLTFTVPGGMEMTLDLAGTTQLAAEFSTIDAKVNGHGASAAVGYDISDSGVVSLRYADGTLKPTYRIPLADVASPDKLTVLSGNVFAANGETGVTVMGFANSAGLGSIKSGSLEGSNVDLASELTEMIESQRSYTANSKVFQTGADLMDVLVNLKR